MLFEDKKDLSGELMLFDVCGETNVTDAIVVLVVRKVNKNVYKVISIDTGKAFETDQKYLTTLRKPSRYNTEVVVRYSNRLNLFSPADHLLLNDIKSFFTNLKDTDDENSPLNRRLNSYIASLSMIDAKIVRHIQNTKEVDMINISENVEIDKVEASLKLMDKARELQKYVDEKFSKIKDEITEEKAFDILNNMFNELRDLEKEEDNNE